MRYLVDSYALLEWFRDKNENYRTYFEEIEETGANITLSVLMESYFSVYHHVGEAAAEIFKKLLKPNFKIIRINQQTVIDAAIIRSNMLKKGKKMSYTDCINYVLAKELNIKILTGDNHFKDLDNVEFVK